MILNMAGGGGSPLNFKVVGNPKPANPKENTIWLNTNDEITGWVFSVDEPTNPSAGMVWIPHGESSKISLNALKKNGIMLYPTGAKQYIGGAWVKKTTQIYQGGNWIGWATYLFNYSNQEYTWQARGWKQSDNINQYAKAPTVTKNSNGSVKLTLSPSQDYTYTSGVYELKSDFSLKDVNTLTLNASANMGELIVIDRSKTAWGGYAVARRSIGSGTLDVSTLTGSYDIALAVYLTKAQSWTATFNSLTAE